MSVFIIGEIGINHNGDMNITKELIDKCSEAGFDAIKFQKRTIDKVYEKDFLDSPRESPWGNTQRDQKNGLEFNYDEYKEIDAYCKKKNILWSASCWDVDSVDFLSQFDIKFHKIASPMLLNKPLLRKVAETGIKTFISTGMSNLEDITQAVNIFREIKTEFELMHCNSTYPMKEENANLKSILTLKEKFNCNVGYSGHESGLLKVCTCAVAIGATSIERHISLDRTMYGSDQASSIEAQGYTLKNFVDVIRIIPEIMGDGNKIVRPEEIPIKEKLQIKVD